MRNVPFCRFTFATRVSLLVETNGLVPGTPLSHFLPSLQFASRGMSRSYLVAALAAACAVSAAALAGDARDRRAARRAGAQRLRLSEREAASAASSAQTNCYQFPEAYGTLSVPMSGVTNTLGNIGAWAQQTNTASGTAISLTQTSSTTAKSYLMPSPYPTSPSGDCAAPTSSTWSATSALWNLLGKTLSVTADVSAAGCGCDAALCACARFLWRVWGTGQQAECGLSTFPSSSSPADFVQMPAYSSSGTITAGGNYDGYCDANAVGGSYCPETDIIEANTGGVQFTAHGCAASSASNGKTYYTSCDKGGAFVNPTCGNTTTYGPGTAYTINSLLPYTVSTSFPVDASGSLTDIQTTLTQGSKSLYYSLVTSGKTTSSSYSVAQTLSSTTAAFKLGMVPVISLWGKDSGSQCWLDSYNSANLCSPSATCASNSKAVFSGISVTSLATAATTFQAACSVSTTFSSC